MFKFMKRLIAKRKTDGIVETISCGDGDEIIDNEYSAETMKVTAEPVENIKSEEPVEKKVMPSTKGLICINNGEKNRYIHPEDPIPEGWVLGGKKKAK